MGAGLVFLAAYGAPAQAGGATYHFDIAPGPLRAELVAFAVQAHVSIATTNAGQCVGTGRALVGRFSPKAGLKQILSGSGCSFRQIDRSAFDIVTLPANGPEAPTPRPWMVGAAPPGDVSPLIVVATRRATPADRLAYSVSAVDRRQLADQGVEDTSTLASVMPSMTVTNLGMGRDKILLRGVSDGPLTGHAQSMVGIYLDDVRLTFDAPDPDLRLTDIESVEVLRGPQGALYGAGSLGGVVHIVAAPPGSSSVRRLGDGERRTDGGRGTIERSRRGRKPALLRLARRGPRGAVSGSSGRLYRRRSAATSKRQSHSA